MKRFIKYTLLVAVLASISLAGCQSEVKNHTQNSVNINAKKSVPHNFIVKDVNGNDVRLSDFKGKKVYINVWASWCGPCLNEIPDLEKTYQKYKDDDSLVFISITYPTDKEFKNTLPSNETKSNIMAAKERLGIQYPIFFDMNDNFVKNYAIRAFPTHIFINSDGSLNTQVSGMINMQILEDTIKNMK